MLRIKVLFICLLIVSSLFLLSWKVCIDPGHGGSDPGAAGTYYLEKQANLDVSLSIRNWLTPIEGVEVGLVRTTDATFSLAQRCEYANSGGYHRFLSVHQNAYNGSVQGQESFRHITQAINSTAGLFQQAVHPWLIWAYNYNDRGMKTADFYVLRNTNMPAILTEGSFIDYVGAYNESQRFATNWNDHIGRQGYGLARGICEHMGLSIGAYDTSSSSGTDADTLIIDDGDPEWSIYGSWAVSSSGGWQEDYRWSSTTYQTDYADYSPVFSEEREWKVYVWYRNGSNRATDALVEVNGGYGTQEFRINQRENGARWNYIGTFTFRPTGGYVRINDRGCASGNVVIADAVMWVSTEAMHTDEKIALPKTLSIGSSYPNPFNSTTTIPFTIGKDGMVNFGIYNSLGQIVKSYPEQYFNSGENKIIWDGTDNNGKSVASGVYFGKLSIGDESGNVRMIFTK